MIENKEKVLDKDFIKYNEEALKQALTIINSDETPPPLKLIMNNVISIIAKQDQIIKRLLPTTKKDVKAILFGQDNDTEGTGKKRDLTKIKDLSENVQDYLSTQYSKLVEESFTSRAKKNDLKAIITNYIVTKQHAIIKDGRQLNSIETAEEVVNEIIGFSVLDKYLLDEGTSFANFIEEIRVDDYNDIRIVVAGKERKVDESFDSAEHAKNVAIKLIRTSTSTQKPQLKIDNAFVRVRLGKTTRCSIMANPVAVRDRNFDNSEDVVHMCIRRQRPSSFTPEDLLGFGSVDSYMDALLKNGVSNGIPMIFYGGTNSGKTGTLGCYINYLRDDTRTITIAEIDELNMRRLDNRIEIEDPKTGRKIRNPRYKKAYNSAITWEVNDLESSLVLNKKGFQGPTNAALTFSPETIIIQESKGSEVKDLMDMAISGHQVFTSVHADNVIILLDRILSMFSQSGANIKEDIVLRQVPYAFFWAVKMVKLADGKRKIQEITELLYYNSKDGVLHKNVLARFEVKDNEYDENGKLVTKGEFKAYNFPSEKSLTRMKIGGLMKKDLDNLKKIFDERNDRISDEESEKVNESYY